MVTQCNTDLMIDLFVSPQRFPEQFPPSRVFAHFLYIAAQVQQCGGQILVRFQLAQKRAALFL